MEFEFLKDNYTLTVDCPPMTFEAQNLQEVYRWIFDETSDPRNFIPQYFKNPKRFNHLSDLEKCKAMGLSMFTSLEGSKQRYNALKERIGDNIIHILGNKIAKGAISENCGVNGDFEKNSHFTHHPAKGIPAQTTFKLLKNEKL